MKCMKHSIEQDDSKEFRVQNVFFMISGSRDTILNFNFYTVGHVTLKVKLLGTSSGPLGVLQL